MNQLEKDRLIEKFMGWELKWSNEECKRGWSFYNVESKEYLHKTTYADSIVGFTTDWNWLMKALKKFDNISSNNQLIDEDSYVYHCERIDNALTIYSIDSTVNALCGGITWYNSTLN